MFRFANVHCTAFHYGLTTQRQMHSYFKCYIIFSQDWIWYVYALLFACWTVLDYCSGSSTVMSQQCNVPFMVSLMYLTLWNVCDFKRAHIWYNGTPYTIKYQVYTLMSNVLSFSVFIGLWLKLLIIHNETSLTCVTVSNNKHSTVHIPEQFILIWGLQCPWTA